MSNKILEKVSMAVKDYQTLRNSLNGSLIINGKSLQTWHKLFFCIHIPHEADPIVCKKLSIQIMKLNQLASSYYTMANARLGAIQSSNDSLCGEKYQEIVRAYAGTEQKLPAAAFLEKMSKVATDDVKALVTVAEVEKNFWKDILNYITRMRKQLENVAMNNALMYKAEGYANAANSGRSSQEQVITNAEEEDILFDVDRDDCSDGHDDNDEEDGIE